MSDGQRHRVRLKDAPTEWEVAHGDTILRAALRAGVPFPYECNSGGCGSCRFTPLEGRVEELWPDAPGLSRRDIRKGRKLACQCRPTSDLTIEARLENERPPAPAPRRFQARYLGRDRLTADMAEFHFAPDAAAAFLPGQYAMIAIPGIGERAYSFSGHPAEAGARLSFIIKRTPDGRASNWLFDQLREGDELAMDAPYGLAHLRDTGRDLVLIAGGSGLSPVLSIARAATTDPAFAGRTAHLFYGGRGPADICTPALVRELGGGGAGLLCRNAISDPRQAADWGGPVGMIHELVARELNDLARHDFYFCGPPPMTDAVRRMLMLDHKVPFGQLHYDRFF